MPYNIQNRLDTQGSRMKEINVDPLGVVTYRRPKDGQSVEITAGLGHSDVEEMVPGVSVTQIRKLDFLIDAADLDFGGGPFCPELGDEIDRSPNSEGEIEVYRVVSMGGDQPPFEWITATKKRMRVHCELWRVS